MTINYQSIANVAPLRYIPFMRSVGMKVNTEVTRHPKVYLRAPFEDGTGRMRIKIEMNTHETTSALSPVRVPFEMRSPWFTGRADVLTFELEENSRLDIAIVF